MKDRIDDLADRLRARREKLGHSQEDAARLVGVSSATLAHWEQGRHRPKTSLVVNSLENYLEGPAPLPRP